ncbi:MAG: hypothetical protein HC774_07770 [Sphingomonadales bacterium]|nr:hypothetical protein [Sphingomonadales bacterium]
MPIHLYNTLTRRKEAFAPIPLPPRQTAEAGGYQKSGIEERLFVKDYYKS